MSTALQAYLLLENRGFLEARPQSGFYVRAPFAALIPEPQFEATKQQPAEPETSRILAEIMEAAADPSNIPFGAGSASAEMFPNRRLNLILRSILYRHPMHSARYEFPPGAEPLRRQIARRSADLGCKLAPRDILITSGALESINLSLRAVTKPGDVIAVESPTYFGIIECAAALGLKVIEISTHPQDGLDLNDLDRAARKYRIKAVVAMTNCHNPLGYVLPDIHKKALAELAGRRDFIVIEDEVYGDLSFTGPRGRCVKAFDRSARVILCSSFSKVLSPGFRIGWVAAGPYQKEVQRLKFLSTVAASSLPQLAAAEFLSSGGYDRHMKRLRTTLAGNIDIVRQAIAKYFPDGTRISRPAGGHMLWLELPPKVDALKLYRAALVEHIGILPGTIFSPTGRFRNYIRINCAQTWSDRHDRALLTVGKLCAHLA